MNANTKPNGIALVRSRNSVLAYFGVNPLDRLERAAFYGRVLGRLAIAGAFVAGAAGYVKGVGLFL